MTNMVSGNEPAVQTVNPLEDSAWDDRMKAFPGATFFHGTPWLRVLQDTYGFQPVFFVRRQEEAIQAIMPLMEVNSWLTGRRGIALPFADECAPLCRETAAFPDFFAASLAQARRRGWRYLECRGGRSLLADAPASISFFGHQLALDGGEARLFAGTEAAVRRAVRKAEQSKLTVTVSQDMAAVRTFHALLGRTRQRHGLPVQPFRFFGNIQRHVLARNHGHVILAWHEGIAVAGAVFFHSGRTALYKFGASDDRRQHLRANNLVMWEAIKWHARQGFSSLDFGRTSPGNAGLRRYKLSWGATERLVEYVRYDLRAGAFVTVKDGTAGWYTRLFRLLPISLSRLAGAVLYRHVA